MEPPLQRFRRATAGATARIEALWARAAEPFGRRPALAEGIGATLAVLIAGVAFYLAIRGVDPKHYLHRDDGVITLSHARNLVDFGFVGINPSGPRVEGFSAPLHFLIYLFGYGITGVGYETFNGVLTWLCTGLVGVSLYFAFRRLPVGRALAVLLTLLACRLLTLSAAFVIWHHSGMENCLFHAAYLGLFVCLAWMLDNGRISWWALIPLWVAASVRTESVYHLTPALLLFGALLFRRDRRVVMLLLVFFGGWVVAYGLKAIYFGALTPNTAHAQKIAVLDNIWAMITADAPQRRFNDAIKLLTRNLGFVALLALALGPWLRRRQLPTLFLCLTLIATAAAYPYFFGITRLDPARTTTYLAVFAVIVALGALATSRIPRGLKICLGLVLLLPQVAQLAPAEPYHVCCKAVEPAQADFTRLASKHGLFRAHVATPDIGAVTFHKTFNIFDLGRLAEPVLARTWEDGPVTDYFFDIAQPDILKLHSGWTCGYGFLTRDPRFAERYRAEGRVGRGHCQGKPGLSGFWVRRDIAVGSTHPERRLMEELARDPSADRLATELSSCIAAGRDCTYVLNSAFRILPELRAGDQLDAVQREFAALPASAFRDYALALLEGDADGQLWAPVHRLLAAHRSAPNPHH